MAINVRRVVTDHDEHGKAVVRIDDRGKHVKSSRPNMTQQLIWTTDDLPVKFAEDGKDKGQYGRGLSPEPGVVPRASVWTSFVVCFTISFTWAGYDAVSSRRRPVP
jgi:hypothetical protein